MKPATILAGLIILFLPVGKAVKGQDKIDTTKVEKALEKNAKAFAKAFNSRDAKAMSMFWHTDGDYITQSGIHLQGREAIAKAFADFFAENKGAKIRINILSYRVVNDSLVIEDGVTEVLSSDGSPPSASRYSLVHVKKDGEWKLASVRDAPYNPPTNYRHLKAIEWLVGDWVDDVKKGEVVQASYDWTDNQNFILGSITTTLKFIPISGATQWIAWDPVNKKIRSWSFASNGGFGEAVWSQEGKKLIIQTKSVMPDGSRLSATNTITRIDNSTLTWQSTNRMMDGKKLPDTDVVRMKRAQ